MVVALVALTCPSENDTGTFLQDLTKIISKKDSGLEVFKKSYRARISIIYLIMKFVTSQQVTKKAVVEQHSWMMKRFTQDGEDLAQLTWLERIAVYLLRKRAVVVDPLSKIGKNSTPEYLKWDVGLF